MANGANKAETATANSDQHQISPCNINANSTRGHWHLGYGQSR